MNINRDNYELYCMDFLDGKLIGSERNSFLLFLENNPDIKAGLDSMNEMVIMPGIISFSDKELLKKGNELRLPVNKYNFNEFCISYVEGNLNESQQKELEQFIITNPAKAKELELFTLTRLAADPSIKFEHKGRLKKHSIAAKTLIPYLFAASTIAAVIILAFLVFPASDKKVTRVSGLNSVSHNANKKEINRTINKKVEVATPKILARNNQTTNEYQNTKKNEPEINSKNAISSEVKISNTIAVDTNRRMTEFSRIPGMQSTPLPTTSDSVPAVKELASVNSGQDFPKDKNTGVITFAETTLQKINELSGNNVKISKKRVKTRKTISFETPIFGFYQSKGEL